MDKTKIYKNSKDEWYTPQSIIDYVNSIAKITLDPCTTALNSERLGINKFYTKEDDGLSKSWANEVVWLNPPFSEKWEWVKKARDEVDNHGAKVFLILPMSFETQLWQNNILGKAKLHIPNRRITFINGETLKQKPDQQITSIIFEISKSAPFGTCLVEMTPNQNNTYCMFEIPPRGKQ